MGKCRGGQMVCDIIEFVLLQDISEYRVLEKQKSLGGEYEE
jgi:hypothetical protein